MMIKIGNFFFKYRNWAFIPMYLALFLPSPDLLEPPFHTVLLVFGIAIALSGQAIRGATIGLAYIRRGGRNKKIHADHLVIEGMFKHCRNPLYIGNILMLLGVGILSNSVLYIGVFIPAFLFIYQAIVTAEEQFLRKKFGDEFDAYCRRVNRWLPMFSGLKATFNSMDFNWRRWLIKEFNTQYVLLIGMMLMALLNYPELTGHDPVFRNRLLADILSVLTALYFYVRYLKKSGKMQE